MNKYRVIQNNNKFYPQILKGVAYWDYFYEGSVAVYFDSKDKAVSKVLEHKNWKDETQIVWEG